MTIVHVAEVDIGEVSGMGRVAWHWRREFERRGHEFIHIGPSDVGGVRHPMLFPARAWRKYTRLGRNADLFIVHEPASGAFARVEAPLAVVSHGLERRNWRQRLSRTQQSEGPVSLKTRVLFPMWRLRGCERGIRRADALLVTNEQDREFAVRYYGLAARKVRVFRNGVDADGGASSVEPEQFTAIFVGSWIERKGICTLREAAERLHSRGIAVKWILAGTQVAAPQVLSGWPSAARASTEVIPSFTRQQEPDLYRRAAVFVLPSLFEGQPLSLLQAMAAARCCVASDCCGQRDVIKHDYSGLLFPPGDALEFARHIETAYSDAASRRRLGENARAAVAGREWGIVSAEVVDSVLGL